MTNDTSPSFFGTTIGLDVSDAFSHFCVLDARGEIRSEGRVRTNEEDVVAHFTTFGCCRVIVEVGAHSPWLDRALTAAGHEVIVANAAKFQLIRSSYKKNDRSDAELLARAGRLDPEMLSPVQHRSKQAQVDLAVLRSRGALVAARTMLINQVRGSVKAVGGALPRFDADYFHRHAPGHLPAELAPALIPLVTAIAALTAQIQQMERELERIAEARYPAAALLRQVNGVGPVTALAFLLTIGDPARFAKSRDIGPYLGLTPKQRQSGGRSPQLGITKAGDTLLRSLLVQAAHYITGPFGKDCDLRRWALPRLVAGGKNQKKRVIVAVARRLAVMLHRLLVTGAVYVPLYRSGGVPIAAA